MKKFLNEELNAVGKAAHANYAAYKRAGEEIDTAVHTYTTGQRPVNMDDDLHLTNDPFWGPKNGESWLDVAQVSGHKLAAVRAEGAEHYAANRDAYHAMAAQEALGKVAINVDQPLDEAVNVRVQTPNHQ